MGAWAGGADGGGGAWDAGTGSLAWEAGGAGKDGAWNKRVNSPGSEANGTGSAAGAGMGSVGSATGGGGA
jgi:hypothetical protein